MSPFPCPNAITLALVLLLSASQASAVNPPRPNDHSEPRRPGSTQGNPTGSAPAANNATAGPTLADNLTLYLWLRGWKNGCVLCEKDPAKQKAMMEEALEEMAKNGKEFEKNSAIRLKKEGATTAMAYLKGFENARQEGIKKIAKNETKFDPTRPEVFVDQYLFEKSRKGTLIEKKSGQSAFLLNGRRIKPPFDPFEQDAADAAETWMKALEKD